MKEHKNFKQFYLTEKKFNFQIYIPTYVAYENMLELNNTYDRCRFLSYPQFDLKTPNYTTHKILRSNQAKVKINCNFLFNETGKNRLKSMMGLYITP